MVLVGASRRPTWLAVALIFALPAAAEGQTAGQTAETVITERVCGEHLWVQPHVRYGRTVPAHWHPRAGVCPTCQAVPAPAPQAAISPVARNPPAPTAREDDCCERLTAEVAGLRGELARMAKTLEVQSRAIEGLISQIGNAEKNIGAIDCAMQRYAGEVREIEGSVGARVDAWLDQNREQLRGEADTSELTARMDALTASIAAIRPGASEQRVKELIAASKFKLPPIHVQNYDAHGNLIDEERYPYPGPIKLRHGTKKGAE
jgi:hypothetical protein